LKTRDIPTLTNRHLLFNNSDYNPTLSATLVNMTLLYFTGLHMAARLRKTWHDRTERRDPDMTPRRNGIVAQCSTTRHFIERFDYTIRYRA
jgi:hypothetical protein